MGACSSPLSSVRASRRASTAGDSTAASRAASSRDLRPRRRHADVGQRSPRPGGHDTTRLRPARFAS